VDDSVFWPVDRLRVTEGGAPDMAFEEIDPALSPRVYQCWFSGHVTALTRSKSGANGPARKNA